MLAHRAIFNILTVPLCPSRAPPSRCRCRPAPAGEPATSWLCEALRDEILAGRLRPGARLPSSRDLARQHGLSRGTIVSAFEQLASEGYLDGSVGSGTYVSLMLPDDLLQVGRRAGAAG